MHFVFAKLRLAEERGLGLKSLREDAKKAGLPLPRFSWSNPYLVLSIFLSTDSVDDARLKSLNKNELAGWRWLSKVGTCSSTEYAESQKMAERTARTHLKRFVELELVSKSGAGKATEYRIK